MLGLRGWGFGSWAWGLGCRVFRAFRVLGLFGFHGLFDYFMCYSYKSISTSSIHSQPL